ncbi:MAG TPA: methyl-accepting chemotaxis protein [Syntrophales bacterium]|nr:methyl-accepting chemotaxis protein [Syntrophales bacterium]
MKLGNWKLSMKMGLGFGVILLLVVVLGGISFWSLRSLSGTAVSVLQTEPKIAEHSSRARANVNAMRRYEKDVFINIGSKDKLANYYKDWSEQKDAVTTRLGDLEKVVSLPQEKDMLNNMRTELENYAAGFNKVYKDIQEGRLQSTQDANKEIDQYKGSIHKMEDEAKKLAQNANQRMDEAQVDMKRTSTRVTGTALALVLISLVLGAFISITITLGITRPLNRVSTGIDDASGQVAAASAQVSSSSQQLAEGASEQAASLEETSSSLEEITSMTRQNADHAQQAKAMMSEAQRIVETVDANMKNMAEAIAEVTKTSEETGKIIKTIDEIAFQTNLLALNAAVEAARAGEAGAGFAVVADEVRNLAIRAADAAKNTSNLIENTIKGVKHGNELTKLTQTAFKENMEIAGKIASLVDEIAAASQEQANGLDQINKAVADMDKVTQQTAANAEESASASEEMNAQAEQLKYFVRDLSSLVSGNGNGHAAESRSERSKKNFINAIHINKALPALTRQIEVKASIAQNEKNINCWEFKKCGREAGGVKAKDLGVCPAYPNHGKHCAQVAGTLCGGLVQGSFATKISNCMQCDYYKSRYYDKTYNGREHDFSSEGRIVKADQVIPMEEGQFREF